MAIASSTPVARSIRDRYLSLTAGPATVFGPSAWWLFGLIIAADVLAAVAAPLGSLGVALWYISYAFIAAVALVAARDIIRHSVRDREGLLPVVIAIFAAIVVVNLTDPRSFSGEAAHEINCALGLLASSSDHGFRGTCLFGYPARQFFLPIVPSLVFGRSQLTLNAGGDLYFLIGVFIFAGGVIRVQRGREGAGLLAALLLTVFLHVYYWNHFMLIYEQSIFPLSFALIGGGLLLYFLAGERFALPLGGILLLYLIDSYTPSLGVYGLGIAAIGYLAYRRSISWRQAAALIGGSLIVLALSLTYRGDLNVAPGGNPTLASDIRDGFENVLLQNHGLPVTSPLLVFPLVMTVALCLGWRFGLTGFAIGLWAVGVYLFTIVAHGYSLNSVDVRTHRAMIIFPVLITFAAVTARRLDLPRMQSVLTIALLVTLLSGVAFHLDYRNAQAPDPSLPFATWAAGHVHDTGTASHPVTMWWEAGSDQFLPAVRDVLDYFYPNMQGAVFNLTPEGACPEVSRLTGIIVVIGRGRCYSTMRARTRSSPLGFDGYYIDESGRPLAVFETAPATARS